MIIYLLFLIEVVVIMYLHSIMYRLDYGEMANAVHHISHQQTTAFFNPPHPNTLQDAEIHFMQTLRYSSQAIELFSIIEIDFVTTLQKISFRFRAPPPHLAIPD
ncbi:hypothetical protein Ctha_1125 [Chloroherpeton thalassium ATCC 35110]|uniref:Uncharacterized protein n=1 Tax=Chloroherpeton thalassium (strain ATCC 35110 / GB-78) TaxID=517418 RepID=B3QYG1_CHLT3|nr:hypothetical protein [Chloroherpeton thalassium]ACF13589.1 hypothetical protein Ctha_1125 [Chloroherpeton thalassium ATCC 35110]